MFCEMSPVVEHSIVKVASGKRLMGSSMICHSDLSAPPAYVVASWTDDNKTTFYPSKAPTAPGLASAGDKMGELSGIDRVHKAGTSAAVWAFGGMHIKVKGWIPEFQLEDVTIEHVRKTKPNIPMPEVIFSWTDEAWDRTFLVLVSIPGRTLYQAWPELRPQQKQQIADEVASYCTDLAISCSRQMETLNGKGILRIRCSFDKKGCTRGAILETKCARTFHC